MSWLEVYLGPCTRDIKEGDLFLTGHLTGSADIKHSNGDGIPFTLTISIQTIWISYIKTHPLPQ